MDNVLLSLSEWIKSIIENTVNNLVAVRELELNATTLGRQEVAEMLGISVDSFDKYYRYSKDFPKELPGKRWSKIAIINYLNK